MSRSGGLFLDPQATAQYDNGNMSTIPNVQKVAVPKGDKCLLCRKPSRALLACPSCEKAPSLQYANFGITVVFYCSGECRTANWQQHKPVCKRLQQRLQLQRTAILLRELWLMFKSRALDTAIEAVSQNGTSVQINTDWPSVLKPGCFVGRYPKHLRGHGSKIHAICCTFKDGDVALVLLRRILKDSIERGCICYLSSSLVY